ncbi:hypothetical protein M406DRAFT_36648, partial [Cryphonectria parasitica EP155]
SDSPTITTTKSPKPGDIAYLFHTSGTSSGLPKPIPQTHHAAVGVLPRLTGGESHASFSTTPLYHGGIADCLRAWSSGAMIHLFPGTQPITAVNVLRAVDRANAYLQGAYPAKYFTSVPYVLQSLVSGSSIHEDDAEAAAAGMNVLQSMDLVGVGGAALPPSLGDDLVSNGVKLISRFGSAECGFLLSSHRDYATDREWSWLRADPSLQPEYYDFMPQTEQQEGEDGPQLFEFVVKPHWPHRGKTNRPDGSFATADLFEQHPTIPNAWRYHSRADAQITLVNGKKFDPAPVEAELLASAVGRRALEDAMIFGTGRDAPGLLLVTKRGVDYVNNQQVIDDVWPVIEKMNSQAQGHAKIGRGSIVVVMDKNGGTTALPKSSKGTILRRQAEKLFKYDIEGVYGDGATLGGSPPQKVNVPDSKVLEELTKLFSNVLGRRVSPTGDLFAQGVDSIACSRLRNSISRAFFDTDKKLPLNIIYEQGSIDQLSKYILRCRNAADSTMTLNGIAAEEDTDEEQLMLDLVEKYRHAIQAPTGSFDHQNKRVVVLTGATGFLGAHILDLLLQDAKVSKVFCLVRTQSHDDGVRRIKKSLKSRGLATVNMEHEQGTRLVCMPCAISKPRLGLEDSDWTQLTSQATMIIHSAWSVNFSLRLKSFEDQLSGLHNLLELRDATGGAAARFVFISSIAAVSSARSAAERAIPETLSSEPEDASPLGYSRSKWVAENICTTAKVGGSVSPPTINVDSTLPAQEKSPIVIIRVGQLCGNKHGVWNMTEAYPIMLSSAKITNCLPDLGEEPLSWLPADVAARAVLDISFNEALDGPAHGSKYHQRTPVYHVLNPHQGPMWSEMVGWIADEMSTDNVTGAHKIQIVSPQTWLHQLETALEHGNHPARSLLHLWKSMYAHSDDHHESLSVVFDVKRAEAASEVMRRVQPLEKEAVMSMWAWIEKNIYILDSVTC